MEKLLLLFTLYHYTEKRRKLACLKLARAHYYPIEISTSLQLVRKQRRLLNSLQYCS